MAQLKVEQEILAAGSRVAAGNTNGFDISRVRDLFITINVTAITGTLVLFFDTAGPTGDWTQIATSGNITATGMKTYSFDSKELKHNIRLRWTITTSFNALGKMTIAEDH